MKTPEINVQLRPKCCLLFDFCYIFGFNLQGKVKAAHHITIRSLFLGSSQLTSRCDHEYYLTDL